MRRNFYVANLLFVLFLLWTWLVRFVDVKPIGPQGITVGFATWNDEVHRFIGVRMDWYTVTDWLGLVPICIAFCFAVVGLVQWCRRKKLLRVDRDIRMLGIFYLVLISVYLFFETVVINYRPILIEGCAEPSYPSSTIMLVLCVMLTAMMQARLRIKNKLCRRCVILVIILFTVLTVIGRILSGVHWFTDIVGSILISAGMVTMYRTVL